MVVFNSSQCCATLAHLMPDLVSLPNSTQYNSSVQSYWSLQEVQLAPSCIVSPSSAQDVSTTVMTLVDLNCCQFAVRGGRHTPFAGSANIADGITIDLSSLNEITITEDHTQAIVGAGQRWGNVYTALQPYGLAVAGGRAASIGVSGLTLGGGTYYFAPKTGFTCDNVNSFEVVLANGSIIDANATHNSDLFLALKGGSNNFGIVTKFTYRTFAQASIWSGNIIYSDDTYVENIKAFSEFVSAPDFDENASLMQTFGFQGGFGAALVNELVYAEPVVNPASLQNFTVIQPQYSNTMSITTLVDAAAALDTSSPYGQILTSITIQNSIPTLTEVFSLWNTSNEDIADVPGIVWSITTQPINNAVLAKTSAPGNSLGLPMTAPTGSFIIVELAASWNSTHDSTFVTDRATKLMADITAAAKAAGSFNRFIDLNHATTGQNPINGYGPIVKAKLLAVSKKYDPRGVFQRMAPGGFKLS